MRLRNIIIFILASFQLCGLVSAQQSIVKKDTITLYRNIETYSRQSKVASLIYPLVFKPVGASPGKKESKKKGYKNLIQKPYIGFEGKIIRNINIVTLDPFGYSANDTTVSKQNFFTNAGNGMHIKTQGITIRNLMLIHKNAPFNSLLVKESERLIRSQSYVHEVSFYVVAAGEKIDSVDIYIRELDKWSFVPEGSISTNASRFGITDKNFLGTGHEFHTDFRRNNATGINSFITNYSIPNIRNTYINAKLYYAFDNNGYFTRNLNVERPFFSPFAKWAAGISLASRFRKDSLEYADTSYVPLNLQFRTQDYWAGKAIQIFKNNSEPDLITNLILAVRYMRIRYNEKPSELSDPLHIYSDEDLFLGEIGISARKYVQDRYIFKFGVIEDVPVGKVFALTGGYQIKPDARRSYLGMRFSFGNYYHWGYLSSNFEYGTFINSSHAEQGVFTAGINYFSGIFEIDRWKFRQFVKPQVTIGINQFSYDTLTLKEGYGLDAFNSTNLSGTRRMLLTLQTQSYAPWYLLGFRFGPYITYSLGMLGDSKTGFKTSKVYSQIGFGVLIKNENLVFNTFQISISFYPLIPGIGQNVFKFNSYKTSDFGFQDFEIGKPSVVVFR
jgi:hypothetical protein